MSQIITNVNVKETEKTIRIPTDNLIRMVVNRSFMSLSKRVWKHFDASEQKRICRVCGFEKPLDQFQKTMPYKGHVYHRRVCLDCRRPSMLVLGKRWGRSHKNRRLEIGRRHNIRRFTKTRGTFECEFHKVIEAEFLGACPIHKLHPDYYCNGKFIEIKRGTTKKEYIWNRQCAHFPGIFFRESRKDLDTQIALYPKPLIVIIFDKDSRKEIARKEFN
jgi:hypothetical protein